jgi:hypothetical protein
MLTPYLVYTQKLASIIQPTLSLSDPRHRISDYDPNPRVMPHSKAAEVLDDHLEELAKDEWEKEVEKIKAGITTHSVTKTLEQERMEREKREGKGKVPSGKEGHDSQLSNEEGQIGTGAPYSGGTQNQERCGVLHFVQGWIQQGQKSKVHWNPLISFKTDFS